MSVDFWSILGDAANVVAVVGIPYAVARQAILMRGADPIEVPFREDLLQPGETWTWPILCSRCHSTAEREPQRVKLLWRGRMVVNRWRCEGSGCRYARQWNRYRTR